MRNQDLTLLTALQLERNWGSPIRLLIVVEKQEERLNIFGFPREVGWDTMVDAIAYLTKTPIDLLQVIYI